MSLNKSIRLKTPEEIEKMASSGQLLAEVFKELKSVIVAGVTTAEINKVADDMIVEAGCIPSFKGYSGFPAACCISVNEEVVHGIPGNRVLKNGDIVGVDCGLIMDGWHSDSAETYAIGKVSMEANKLMTTTRECLALAIEQAIPGNRISDIGIAVETKAHENGFSVVETLVGHGIGRELHEDPQVPNYRCLSDSDPIIEEGLVIAIEPMINIGTKRVVTESDGWTILTADRKLSAHYEHTVAVTANGPRILTWR